MIIYALSALVKQEKMKGVIMNQNKDEMLDEYDFSKGIRGKYAKRYAEGTNIVLLAQDVADFFPDSESVNKALRLLIDIAQHNAIPRVKVS
jgi:hypothetical protein